LNCLFKVKCLILISHHLVIIILLKMLSAVFLCWIFRISKLGIVCTLLSYSSPVYDSTFIRWLLTITKCLIHFICNSHVFNFLLLGCSVKSLAFLRNTSLFNFLTNQSYIVDEILNVIRLRILLFVSLNSLLSQLFCI
jgi:hypothetical protein